MRQECFLSIDSLLLAKTTESHYLDSRAARRLRIAESVGNAVSLLFHNTSSYSIFPKPVSHQPIYEPTPPMCLCPSALSLFGCFEILLGVSFSLVPSLGKITIKLLFFLRKKGNIILYKFSLNYWKIECIFIHGKVFLRISESVIPLRLL